MTRTKLTVREGPLEAALANGAALLGHKPAAAALQAREILKDHPENTAAHRLFARAMERLGRPDDARMARARAVQFSRQVRVLVEAHQTAQSGHPEKVEAMLADHLGRNPDDPVALTISGNALVRLCRYRDAVQQFERSLAFMPEYREAGVALVRAHQQYFDIPAALAALAQLMEFAPDSLELLRWRAALLSNLQENEAAAEILAGLVQRNADMPDLWVSLGDELRKLGRADEAHRAYRRANLIDPAQGRPWWGLAALRNEPFSDADRAALERAVAQAAGKPASPHLHFALGHAYDQVDRREEAFASYAAGNALLDQQNPFDLNDLTREVDLSRKHLTAAFFARPQTVGQPRPVPIFIVGMPRSGSTLVEQLLACHPACEGIGELPFIPVLVRLMLVEHGLSPSASYRELLTRLPAAELAAIGQEYLRLARGHRKTDKPYFVDKLPHNWVDVGFIKLILPNARIVDVRRAPMDCCWSNYRTLFAGGHPSSNSLGGMAAFYRQYVSLMAHWDAVLPGAITRVVYEHLIEDFEPQVRRLLDRLGLPFEPACLDFHELARPVATASAEQVRQPLNRSGIETWKAYAAQLWPLRQAVGDLEESYADR